MFILLLNGPPGCGKDAAVTELAKTQHFHHFKFAEPLKLQCCALLDCSMEWLEHNKDRRLPELKGGTPREYLINLSEKMIKPVYGDDFFGHIAVGKLKKLKRVKLAIASDSGFKSESIPLADEFGANAMLKIEIHREGKNFAGDSRSYWTSSRVQQTAIFNNGTIAELALKIYQFAHPLWS